MLLSDDRWIVIENKRWMAHFCKHIAQHTQQNQRSQCKQFITMYKIDVYFECIRFNGIIFRVQSNIDESFEIEIYRLKQTTKMECKTNSPKRCFSIRNNWAKTNWMLFVYSKLIVPQIQPKFPIWQMKCD